MPYLSFIDDQLLETIVSEVLKKGQNAHLNSNINKNVIDPFSILFELSSFSITSEQWFENEKIRQSQKTLSNHVGFFHQNVLGAINGWKSLGTGGIIDVISHEKKIIAEIKNKHNTVKGSDKIGVYQKLSDFVTMKGHLYKNYTAYYVEIIPKKPERYNKCFTPSDSQRGKQCETNELVRQIDGYSFYALATGVEDALQQLFSVLPEVIAKIKPECKTIDIEHAKKFFNKAFY